MGKLVSGSTLLIKSAAEGSSLTCSCKPDSSLQPRSYRLAGLLLTLLFLVFLSLQHCLKAHLQGVLTPPHMEGAPKSVIAPVSRLINLFNRWELERTASLFSRLKPMTSSGLLMFGFSSRCKHEAPALLLLCTSTFNHHHRDGDGQVPMLSSQHVACLML